MRKTRAFSDNFVSSRARLARMVAVDVAHHVTQRGNRRECILSSDAERTVYLDPLRQSVQFYPLSLGYFLDVEPRSLNRHPYQSDALALAFNRPKEMDSRIPAMDFPERKGSVARQTLMLDRNPFMGSKAAHVRDDHFVPFTQSGLDFNEFRSNHAEAHGYAGRVLVRH